MSTPQAPQPGTPAQGVPVCYRHTDRETHIRCQRCERPICPDCMNQAAVGFQCPTCVREGSKTVRQAGTAYGGKRSGNPALTSQVLIVINVAVYLLITATGGSGSPWLYRLALLPTTGTAIIDGQPTVFQGVSDGAYWQLLTSAFTHLDLWHIGFNMVALWVLGPQLEMVLGRTRFLAIYFLSALSGSALVYWLSNVNTPTIGASGALFGLMGALLIVAYKVKGNVSQLMMWIGLNFLITVVGRAFISWQGHLGGFVGGLLLAAVFVYAPKAHRSRWQLVGAVALGVLLVFAITARTAVLTS
ncbi:MAG: rhomboid family intramembrane serine protease [Nocardioides sp.]